MCVGSAGRGGGGSKHVGNEGGRRDVREYQVPDASRNPQRLSSPGLETDYAMQYEQPAEVGGGRRRLGRSRGREEQ